MILALAPGVRRRLAEIEATEGMPPVELAHQAIAVWGALTEGERRVLGIAAMRIVAGRLTNGGTS